MDQQLRSLLQEHAKLSVDVASLNDDTDLFSVGLSSFSTVRLMLSIENAFDIEFPDHLLTRQTFESIASIRNVVTELLSMKVADGIGV
ncbi:acyl carrier protein [Dongia soli]|uniref:Acyl carrier protein n=1 Tax=Dongia soli TaxID=600628 RepID=A0ABU5ED29_9PROT|nr:acyl carrier protein [Dongia soli]MDY0884251.1 acyl carrier protein [Dongia soli]